MRKETNPAILATVARLLSYFPFDQKDIATKNKVACFEKKALKFLEEKEVKGEQAFCFQIDEVEPHYPLGLWCSLCGLPKGNLPKKTNIMTYFKDQTSVVLAKDGEPQEQLYPVAQKADAA